MVRTAFIYAALLIVAHGALHAAGRSWQWAAGGGGNNSDDARSVAAMPDGGAVVTGLFTGTAKFGDLTLVAAGNTDAYIARYSAAGACLWARRVGGESYDGGYGVGVDHEGNVYVTGMVDGAATISHESGTDSPLQTGGDRNVFVASFAGDGKFRWAMSEHGDGLVTPVGIALDADGGVYATGSYSGAVAVGDTSISVGGGKDIYLMKLNASNGALAWLQRAGGPGNDGSGGVAVDGGGNVYLAGTFAGSATFGSHEVHGEAPANLFVARYDRDGNAQWAIADGGGGSGPYVSSMAADNMGNVYVVGSFFDAIKLGTKTYTGAGEIDGFVAAYDVQGAYRWSAAIAGPVADDAAGVAADAAGNVFVTGGSQTLPKGSFYVIVYGRDGRQQGVYSDDGATVSHTARSMGIAADGHDGAIVCGSYSGRITFGTSVLNSVAGTDGSEVSDMFVARIGTAAGVADDAAAGACRILGCAPNPCSDRAGVTLHLGDAARVSVAIMDMRGVVVRREDRGAMAAGDHTITVPAGDLPQGPYLLELRAGAWTAAERIDVMR